MAGDKQNTEYHSRAGDDSAPIVFGLEESWTQENTKRLLLDSAFHNPEFTDFICNEIASHKVNIRFLGEFLTLIGQFLEAPHDTVSPEQHSQIVQLREDFVRFTQHITDIQDVLSKDNKANPFGIFWPWPGRFEGPQSLDEVTPYMLKHPIMDETTPIGAAGSCFAEEVSKSLQQWGFNYVVTEPPADGSTGVMSESHLASPGTVTSCAQWGILFNTPSFRQLVERAYGERKFKKILVQETNAQNFTYFTDPYREGVYFESLEAYEADYDRHLAAVRSAFETCEIFVITPGLNECWEFLDDGTVLSRNARHSSIRALTRPKTLTYQENIEALQGFIDIVRHHNPEMKFIISVSPVPFLATTQGHRRHVVEANTHSKSMLRVVAEEMVNANRDVFYCPSYEMVTVCSSNPWEADLRHVKRETVDKIMRMFTEIFVRGK